jgi:hypothetical protein
MEVESENYKGFRIAVYQIDDRYECYIFTGAFGYHVVQHFTEKTGLPPTKLFTSIAEALEHAKSQIDTDKGFPGGRSELLPAADSAEKTKRIRKVK